MVAACQQAFSSPVASPVPAAAPLRQSSSSIALAPDGRRLAAANPDSGSITLVDVQALVVQAEIPVDPQPRSVAFTPDGALVLVAARSGTLSLVEAASARVLDQLVIGGAPYGVVADSRRAYASLSALAQVADIDLASRAQVALISRLAWRSWGTISM
jgi:YVTN family beta-propeller protein